MSNYPGSSYQEQHNNTYQQNLNNNIIPGENQNSNSFQNSNQAPYANNQTAYTGNYSNTVINGFTAPGINYQSPSANFPNVVPQENPPPYAINTTVPSYKQAGADCNPVLCGCTLGWGICLCAFCGCPLLIAIIVIASLASSSGACLAQNVSPQWFFDTSFSGVIDNGLSIKTFEFTKKYQYPTGNYCKYTEYFTSDVLWENIRDSNITILANDSVIVSHISYSTASNCSATVGSIKSGRYCTNIPLQYDCFELTGRNLFSPLVKPCPWGPKYNQSWLLPQLEIRHETDLSIANT
eukprot:NODE_196_length_13278_cov_0.565217.p2 type:complete len:295 gc:universal NODE_196_length_13278_cov_0.565217:11921-12805(+)